MLGTLGHRVRTAALDFASWGPSAGILLVLATVAAIVVTNSPIGPAFEALWRQEFGVSLGAAAFRMSILHWVNDGLLTVFFLVVGLEVKREMTVGHLANRRSAALPLAAALGGMVVPALLYARSSLGAVVARVGRSDGDRHCVRDCLDRRDGRARPRGAAHLSHRGGHRRRSVRSSSSPCSTPARSIRLPCRGCGGRRCAGAANRSGHLLSPYVLLGVALWAFVYAGGLHATLAGVVLALFVPTRPPADLAALMTQASTIIASEARHEGEVLRHGPSTPALHALDAIYDRLESPADRLLRHAGARSSYAVLPIFALANAGVAINPGLFVGHGWLMAAIVAGLAIGKSLGVYLAAAAAVRAGIAVKPAVYTWRQLAGAGALAGIGFTMSLFIAGQAFPSAPDFSAAKIAVFAASILSAVVGTALLWGASRQELFEEAPQSAGMQVS